MPESTTLDLNAPDPDATLELGASLAAALDYPSDAPLVIGLQGELGAGKTTLVRGFLRALGITGTVRSPTFTLFESYSVAPLEISHLDLYRVQSAQEIEALGVRELLEPGRVFLIEWPERGQGALPLADLEIHLSVADPGRRIAIRALSTAGKRVLSRLTQAAAKRRL
ncbi:MAG TPA: tRNA (adenosine(37)-N6)-threonylcarbamoyltransferase complex ATPase subunit type 1 TsaE [Steroidobacteraceae bacterium]|nr:tRNA (adenosine(37)-N6)-threonylcarbamoyltransferase complex ATPase subunit type 1 TsaE [Steroidobacteraceae bacterium]